MNMLVIISISTFNIRVEKWVEKLVIVGKNHVWKKDRNMYARLLLSMVIAKTMEEPFHTTPSDGPLSPFPVYLKSKLKGVVGPHESFFWRDVYERMAHDKTESSVSRMSSHIPAIDVSTSSYDPNQKETHTLRMLIQEQARRIEILEQQMAEERMRHESEVRRLLEHHKAEVHRLKHSRGSRSISMSDHEHTIPSSALRRSYDSTVSFADERARTPLLSHNRKPVAVGTPYVTQSNGDILRSFETNRLSSSIESKRYQSDEIDKLEEASRLLTQHLQDKKSPQKNLGVSSTKRGTIPPEPQVTANDEHKDDRYLSISPPSQSISPSLSFEKNEKTTNFSMSSHRPDLNPSWTDSKPIIDDVRATESDVDNKEMPQELLKTQNEKSSVDRSADDIFQRSIPEDDGEFLSYLEDFQTQIRHLQFGFGSSSSNK